MNPTTRREAQIAAFGKRTPENAALILALVEKGVPEGLAAQRAGIDPDTLTNWKHDDPEMADLVEIARTEAVCRKIARVDEAGQRGDWKADSWYLEKSRLTRDEFGAGGNQGRGFGNFNVILRVPSPWDAEQPPVDVTPDVKTTDGD